MMQRQVTIAKDADIDLEALAVHPLIVKCWRLPRGYTLFEQYHPVFEHTCNSDYEAARAALRAEPYKSQHDAARLGWRKLLAPAYADGKGDHMFVLMTQTATYWFEGRERYTIKWPRIGVSKNWEGLSRIRIVGRLFLAIPEAVENLKTVFSEWQKAIPGEVVQAGDLVFTGDGLSANYEFEGPCGDATMALFMLLTATRHLTSLEAIGFFLPDDYSTLFWHPGGEGEKMPQGGWPSGGAGG